MLSLQKSFKYEGDINSLPEKKLKLTFIGPVFKYTRLNPNDSIVTREINTYDTVVKPHNMDETDYHVEFPPEDLMGLDEDTVRNFLIYSSRALTGDNANINDISLGINVEFVSDTNALIGVKNLPCIYFIKNISILLNSTAAVVHSGVAAINYKEVAAFLSSNTFLINKEAYQQLLPTFWSITNSTRNMILLNVVQKLIERCDISPVLPLNFDNAMADQLILILREENIENHQDAAEFIRKHFERLFDFKLACPEIKQLEVAGSFFIKADNAVTLGLNDFLFYDLTIEHTSKGAKNKIVPHVAHFDWKKNPNAIQNNRTAFSFSDTTPIVSNSIEGPVRVRVKDFNGAVIWANDFDKEDPELRDLQIEVLLQRPTAMTVSDTDSRKDENKKLRGQLIELTKKCPLHDITVLIQAKADDNKVWRIVGAATTDKSGNFSIPYPYGVFKKAQAVVSLTPDTPADIPIRTDGKENETISDDFLFLLVEGPECVEVVEAEEEEEDCDCHAPKKASRLPDQADLINSDEYTQDIGGSCVNLSTPNRTLSEYHYQAIVRTYDPDVANYTLKKSTASPYSKEYVQAVLGAEKVSPIQTRFELVGGAEKITRSRVDLDNPIQWQDAPDAKDNLSLYQAVTVATGHILHYKAVTKADGYSLGNLLYSLALAPGQKKQIVVFDSSHTLLAAEAQHATQSDSLTANIEADRGIDSMLGGSLNEFMQGNSSTNTSGVSGGLGIGVSLGIVGGALGVSGGTANSSSSASQNNAKNVSQYFNEKLKQSVTQNASDYRELNASVVTTVQEGQKYAATTEVVANHNHCHALTMMYFEVLRHYAIYQELANVEECVFVPLLMTNFTVENIYKWNDVLAANLLAMPSNTYLQPFSWIRRHPLLKAFDANERIKTSYANVDFPKGRYCDENISAVSGTITIRANIPRPKTRFDRILSLPIIRKTISTPAGVDIEGTIKDNIKSSVVGALTGGLSLLFGGGPSVKYAYDTHEVLTPGKIFDLFMNLDENFESVPPAQCIRVHNFNPVPYFDGVSQRNIDFFGDAPDDKKLWDAYASILGMSIYELLNKFSGNVISDWDKIFYDDIAPQILKELIHEDRLTLKPLSKLDLTAVNRYSGREQLLKYNFRATTSLTRAAILQLDLLYNINAAVREVARLTREITLDVENLTVNYTTNHYNGRIYAGYVGGDLMDNALIPTPLNFDEKRNPRLEDIYIVNKLIEHLNSNLEYYNKVLWYKLDVDRRFMLLDGFSIEIYNDFGVPVGSRSLASVVKNQLITVVGNSLVFPVAAGYRVSQSYILEETENGDSVRVTLLDHYKPLTPIPPYRVSVPSRGVFAEAVQGACDACEKIKENTSQDWTKFTTDEPTPIAPVVTPVPTITDWKAVWKDFAPPLINIQNAPPAPAPGAGFAGLSELLGKSGIFKDITGLDANQQNVLKTYLSNQENARAFAEMAKGMSMQNHNTDHSDKIMDSLKTAKDSGAINQEDYSKLVKQHLQQQIDGGDSLNKQEAKENKKDESSPIKSAVALAQTGNKDVSATESDAHGNTKTLEVKSKGDANLKYNFTVPGTIGPIKQQTANACWATVTTMMSNWKTQQSKSVDDYITSIGTQYVPFIQTGITLAKLGDFCTAAGLKSAYSNTEYPVSYYYETLQKHGPIWVIDLESSDPKMLHGRLLVGLRGDDSSPSTVFTIIDPATGSKYDEDLPTFVRKTENVIKTLEALPDAAIPLLIHFEDTYDKSKFADSPGGATIGSPGPSIVPPAINTKIADFKAVFSANPKILTSGQFHIRDLVYNEIIAVVQSDLAAKPDVGLQNIWNTMRGQVGGYKSMNLFNAITARGLAADYPHILKVYGPDPTATPVWAQNLYKQFWSNSTINPSPAVTPPTVARDDAAYFSGGVVLNGKPTGEMGACHNSTHALGAKYLKAKGLGPIPANLKISEGQTAGVKTPVVEGTLERIVYASPAALKTVVDKIKKSLDAGFPVVCGVLSGLTHDTIKFPKPEHFVLVFGYENNVFAFWDSDVTVSNIATFGWGPGFGVLVHTDNALSTGWDDADLRAVDSSGNHTHFPKRHRYQVYSVQTLPV